MSFRVIIRILTFFRLDLGCRVVNLAFLGNIRGHFFHVCRFKKIDIGLMEVLQKLNEILLRDAKTRGRRKLLVEAHDLGLQE